MKKMLTLALAVLGFTAAQAVTVNWSTNDGSADTLSRSSLLSCAISFAAASYASTNFPTSGIVELQEILIAKRGDSYDLEIATFKLFDEDSTEIASGNVATVSGFVTTLENGDSYTHAAWQFLFSDTEIDVTKTYTLTAYESDGTPGVISSSVVKDNGQDWVPSMKVTAAAVPEPTALALLALGVAGVALKRKKVVA